MFALPARHPNKTRKELGFLARLSVVYVLTELFVMTLLVFGAFKGIPSPHHICYKTEPFAWKNSASRGC